MKYLLFIVSSVTLLMVACTKDAVVSPDKASILKSKKWRITGGTVTVKRPDGKDTAIPYYDLQDECNKDNYLTFDSLYFGQVYANTKTCNAADPVSRTFTWKLNDKNDNLIDLYGGFNMIYCVNQNIEPYVFETLSTAPLVLDTLIGRLDTIPGFIKQFIVLDTIRKVTYTPYKIPSFDLYGAEISDFSSVSFKLKFSFKTTRLDSTNFHAGIPENFPPYIVNDTADYSLIISSF